MACYDEALAYSTSRVMFDKPIGGFQLQQQRLADMLTEIMKAQLLSLHLGRLKDAGNAHAAAGLARQAQQRAASPPTSRARRADSSAPTAFWPSTRSMRHMANLESVYTYEGTHDIHTLILGQAVTGLSAFN